MLNKYKDQLSNREKSELNKRLYKLYDNLKNNYPEHSMESIKFEDTNINKILDNISKYYIDLIGKLVNLENIYLNNKEKFDNSWNSKFSNTVNSFNYNENNNSKNRSNINKSSSIIKNKLHKLDKENGSKNDKISFLESKLNSINNNLLIERSKLLILTKNKLKQANKKEYENTKNLNLKLKKKINLFIYIIEYFTKDDIMNICSSLDQDSLDKLKLLSNNSLIKILKFNENNEKIKSLTKKVKSLGINI